MTSKPAAPVTSREMIAGDIRKPHCATGSSRDGRTRVVVLESEHVLDHCDDHLAEELDVVVRVPLSWEFGQLHVVLAQVRPKLVLLKAPLESLDTRLMALCRTHRVDILVLARPGYGMLGSVRLRRLGGLPWLRLRSSQERASMLVKRAIDVVLVVLSLPFVVPLLLVVAAFVCWDGPLLYVQNRVGRRGRLFRLVKIRTMRVDVERETGPIFAQADDPRVIAVGRVLRRLRIDEIPQLWNVLRGDMSLVGPRPERPEFVTKFRQIPLYDLRHVIRPGLTGIAQLTGGYAATVEDKLRCDLLYVSCRSLHLDIKVLAQTFAALLRGFPCG
jgi:lipopolysaccharide/colanic/teichoic acid biosynthesis glycosyltransferase